MVVRLKWAASAAVIAFVMSGNVAAQADPNSEAARNAALEANRAAKIAMNSAASAQSAAGNATQATTAALGATSEAADAAGRADLSAKGAERAAAKAEDAAKAALFVARNEDLEKRERMLVGASGLWERDPVSAQPLGRALDGCLIHRKGATADDKSEFPPGETAWENAFSCSIETARGTVRLYRQRAGLRQDWTDSMATVSVTSFAAAAIGGTKAAASTTSGFVGLGTISIIGEDLAASGPRGRLYALSSVALNGIIWRYQTLFDAQSSLAMKIDPLRVEIDAACDQGLPANDIAKGGKIVTQAGSSLKGLQAIRGQLELADAKSFKGAFSDQIANLSDRCAALQTTAIQLQTASQLWQGRQSYLALSLARDVSDFDDTVARIDRSLRTSPSEAFGIVLSAPFALATNIIRGGAANPGYTARTLTAFASPITFELTRLPTPALPVAIQPNLGRSVAIDGQLKDMKAGTTKDLAIQARSDVISLTGELNSLSVRLSQIVEFSSEVRRLNEFALVTINYSSANNPVVLSAPQPRP